jgi:glutamate-ammonia-ligase adenylyltransferase
MLARPQVAERFVEQGSRAVIADPADYGDLPIDAALRCARLDLALAVALGDLAGEMTLEQVTRTLSEFADNAIDRAIAAAVRERVPDAEPIGLTAIAMGKLGSFELNYSSDVDLILLFDPATLPRRAGEDPGEAAVRIGRRVVEILQKRTADGYVVRVDLRLRPAAEVTPIVLPVNAAISHYESSALAWERAAFIRARACAGDLALGNGFLAALEPFVWRRSLGFGAIDDVRQISVRIRDHFAQGSTLGPGFDLKRGRGGIREVEFFAQIQQMIHGGRDPSVRCPATLDALGALAKAGWLDESDAAMLAEAYRLLRTVEHRVQMIDDAQTHQLPVDSTALDAVAALHGTPDGGALLDLLRPHVSAVETLFGSIIPEHDGQLSKDADVLLGELRELGFADPAMAARRIADWRSGRARSLRSAAAQSAFEAMLPGMLRAIAAGPDPGHALNRLSDVVERLSSGINLFRLLEAHPVLAEMLVKILVHAPALSDQLATRPELLEGLFDSSSFAAPPEPDEVAASIRDAMRGHPLDIALDRARRLVNERRFALGVQLIASHEDPLEVAAGYARVAEGTLLALTQTVIDEFEAAHGRVSGELIILGLGRLGGGALTDASDLDLIFLHTAPPGVPSDGPRPLGPADYFNRLASRVTAAMSVPTPAGPLYEVDTRLRPEGAKGMLAVSLDAFERYQRDEAWTWEHMALCRARPLFGSPEGLARAAAVIGQVLARPRPAGSVAADAAKMRGEMGAHKPPRGELDVKLGPGGLVDLEFAVHVLQLTRGIGLDPRLDVALRAFCEAGLVEPQVIDAHQLLTRLLVMMRLVAPGEIKPTATTWALVAEACGCADHQELLARLGAARQSVGELWNRVKEG